MTRTADVRSIAALEQLRAALCTFHAETRSALDQLDMDVRHALDWVEHDLLQAWKDEWRRRSRAVEFAKADLNCARAAFPEERSSAVFDCKRALDRAKHRHEEAEEKIAAVRRWTRVTHQEADDFRGPVQQFAELLTGTMHAAIAELDRMITTLEAYAAVPVAAAPSVTMSSAPPSVQASAPAPPGDQESR